MDVIKGSQLLAELIAERGEQDAPQPAPVPDGTLPVFGWAHAKRPAESGTSGIAEAGDDARISP